MNKIMPVIQKEINIPKRTAANMEFTTEVKWKTERKMELKTSNGIELNAGPPPEFNGYENVLTAEESFVGSINLCWVSTLLVMKEKLGVEVRSVECKTVGTVGKDRRKHISSPG